jgi:hypothetical protein
LFKDVLKNTFKFFTSESGYGIMIGHLSIGKAHEINVLSHSLLNLATGVGIIHISIHHHLQNHLRVVTGLTLFTIGFYQWLDIQMLDHSIDDPNGMVWGYQFLNGGW